MTEVVTWAAWLGGLAIGAYAVTQFVLTGRALGVSSGYGNLCALGSRQRFFCCDAYGQPNAWRLWFLAGLPLGGVLAALSSPGPLTASFSLGTLYDSVIPENLVTRFFVLLLGGALMGYGARQAGGCTSGHAITGISLLNWPSMVAAAGFFAGGILMVQLLFGLGSS
jgi:hypothetical protein